MKWKIRAMFETTNQITIPILFHHYPIIDRLYLVILTYDTHFFGGKLAGDFSYFGIVTTVVTIIPGFSARRRN